MGWIEGCGVAEVVAGGVCWVAVSLGDGTALKEGSAVGVPLGSGSGAAGFCQWVTNIDAKTTTTRTMTTRNNCIFFFKTPNHLTVIGQVGVFKVD